MRWVVLLVLCASANLFNSGMATAAAGDVFHISGWAGRSYWNQQEKQLDRCSAQLTNADKITIIYSLDRNYMWSLLLSSPAWNFTEGASFFVTLGSGKFGYLKQRAVATEAHLVRVKLPDSLSVFEALRSLVQLELIAGGLTSRFDLTFNNQVLAALTRCVVRHGATSRSRAAIAAWSKSLTGHGSSPNFAASNQKEASALAAEVITTAAIPKAASLRPNEIPVGLTGDAFWRADKILFSLSILPPDTASGIAELPGLIIGGDAQKCRGDFFSGAAFDVVNASRLARVFTSCLTPQATTSVYYLAIPRKQGGFYLLATVTTGFDIAVPGALTARDVDGKIRASIGEALSKFQQAKK